MAKSKTIEGITYFPQKHHDEGCCTKCGNSFDTFAKVYRVGSLSSSEYVCAKCVNRLYMEKQVAKDRGAVEFPLDDTIFVGTRHKCGKVILESIPFYFKNEEKAKKIIIKKCPVCTAYFVATDVQRANSFYFQRYNLISTDTGKKILPSVIPGFVASNRKREYEKEEIPESVQWALAHPFQGGTCSGK